MQRGLRWQRYCWFCKEFWQARVDISGMRPAQTRIPEVPDQSAFLERWYEFHRGYRIVRGPDGGEERVAVLGEQLKDVDPGFLPRTLEELRAGRAAETVAGSGLEDGGQVAEESGPGIEQTLDQLFEDAAAEEDSQSEQDLNEIANATFMQGYQARVGSEREIRATEGMQRTAAVEQAARVAAREARNQRAFGPAHRDREYQSRRVAALRRELQRMRSGIERVISGLRDLGEQAPDVDAATGRLTDLSRTLDVITGGPQPVVPGHTLVGDRALATVSGNGSNNDIQSRVNEARAHMESARESRDQAASELDLAEQEFRTSSSRLQHLQREQRTAENYTRIFGTREEMLAQGEQYESPIGGMFNRAFDRYRAAEEVRQEERTLRQVLEDEAIGARLIGTGRFAALVQGERDVWSMPVVDVVADQGGERSGTVQVDQDGMTAVSGLTGVNELEDERAMARELEVRRSRRLEDAESFVRVPVDTPTDNAGVSLGSSDELEVGFAMARAQQSGGSEEEIEEELDPALRSNWAVNFPRTMLGRVLHERDQQIREENAVANADSIVPLLIPRETAPHRNIRSAVWYADAEHILMALRSESQEFLSYHDLIEDDIYRLLQDVDTRSLAVQDLITIEILLNDREVLWRTRAITARFERRRSAGQPIVFHPADEAEEHVVLLYENIEIMAETFQRSATIRRRAHLSAPDQLRMLYRLQAGERTLADMDLLMSIMQTDETVHELVRVEFEQANVAEQELRRLAIDDERREAARQGEHSREELDAQRRAAQAFAIAASRAAMAAGPTVLLERMAERHVETRAAYEQMERNGLHLERGGARRMNSTRSAAGTFANLADTDEEDEPEDEEQGLDARDSGRPEAKTDEEMMVSLSCRICYTQTAEIACLPCGHLVMCKWCSEQHSPVLAHDRTRPRRAAGCPVCRKGIRQKVRVFRA